MPGWKRPLWAIFLCFLSFFFRLHRATEASENAGKPRWNVLLITIDTLRPDRLSCYEGPSPGTPRIDGLAENGVLFTRAFAHTPVTLPSHADILLGTTPLYHGVHDNNNFIVRDNFLTLAEHLKTFGYSTGAFVGAYLLDSRFGLNQGFDVYDDGYERSHDRKISTAERKAEEVIGNALGWLKTRNSPWFLWLHCYDPHDAYDPPEPFKSRFRKTLYDGEVAYVDSVLGKLFDFMQDNGLFDDTLVVFTADHGESLGQHGEMTHGFLAYNSTLWVPFIVKFPGSVRTRVTHPVSHIDIFPTICDILQIDKPPVLQGVSLVSLIKGGTGIEKPIYFESLYPYYSRGWAPIRGFIQNQAKFIDSPIPEIYDLSRDFQELHDLAGTNPVDQERETLARIVRDLSSPDADRAVQKIDHASLEKLKSLGYLSSSLVSRKEEFGPEDDVKAFLPFNNDSIRAVQLYQEGKTREGINLLRKVLEKKKSLDSAYSNLAVLLEWEGKIRDGLDVLRSGLRNIPSSYELFFNYISLSVKHGLFDEAIAAFDEHRYFQAENDPELLNELGLAYSCKGDYGNAMEIYGKAMALDGRFPALHHNLGMACLSLSMKNRDALLFRKSVESFKRAIELDPHYALAYNGLGTAYRQARNLDGAIFCWEKALDLDPDFIPILYSLGLAYMDKEDFGKALPALMKFRDRRAQPVSPEERERLDALIRTCREKAGKR